MDGQREQVKGVTDHAEELHARKIDVFRDIPATTAARMQFGQLPMLPDSPERAEGVAELEQTALCWFQHVFGPCCHSVSPSGMQWLKPLAR